MADDKTTTTICACGCGKAIVPRPWHKYRPARYHTGHGAHRKGVPDVAPPDRLCACGCGLPILDSPVRKYYQPKFRVGHNTRKHVEKPERSGYCACGCGEKTKVPERNGLSKGQIAGVPLLYVHGHNRRGGEFSESHRAKISASKVGVPKSFEHRQKLADALKGHPSITGPANKLWKGGPSVLARTREDQFWARSVKRRDRGTCQICGHSSRTNMHAHHIKSYADHPELRLDINNGITLCQPCHALQHPDVHLMSHAALSHQKGRMDERSVTPLLF